MAVSADVPEPIVGALILAPRHWTRSRYFRPQWTWAKWVSRATKSAGVTCVEGAESGGRSGCSRSAPDPSATSSSRRARSRR
jgi:hypothetical protein